MIVLNIVLDPLANWVWLGVLVALTVLALVWRSRRRLRLLAVALVVLTAVFREQSIPKQVDAAVQRQHAVGPRAEGYRAGASSAMKYVRDTQLYAVVTVGLLTALALIGRRRKED